MLGPPRAASRLRHKPAVSTLAANRNGQGQLRAPAGPRCAGGRRLTNGKLEAARAGNWFLARNLVIARLDKLSRDEDVQAKLAVPEAAWDMVRSARNVGIPLARLQAGVVA